MKNFMAFSLIALSFSSFAGTQAELVLQGSVGPILDISIEAEAEASSLPLDYETTPVVTDLAVGVITEKSNYATGYSVTAVSINNGVLAHETDTASSVDYHLYYEGQEIVFNGSTPVEVYTTSTLKGEFTKDLTISYSVPENLSAGNYEDKVQFTIQQN